MCTLFTNIKADIISTGHITSGKAAYNSTDIIYYYKQISDATLSASSINGGTSNTFTWSKYNEANGTWNTVASQIGATSELSSPIAEGGYRVVIDNGTGTNETYQCWVLVPQLQGSPETDTIASGCFYLDLKVTGLTTKKLTYYNPANNQSYDVNYNLKYSWQADGVEVDSTNNVNNCSLEAPYTNARYKAVITEKLTSQNIEASDISITAIAVYADFKLTTDEDEDNKFHINQDQSAKLVIKCDASKTSEKPSKGNINNYNWSFGEVEKVFGGSAIESWSYRAIGDYNVRLTVSNSYCTDSSEVQSGTIDDIELIVPNYLNPDDNDENIRVFRVTYKSVKSFDMVIVNRWGRVVFSTKDPDEGWDGRIGGQKAAPGVYYYDIVANGFYKTNKHKKGFLHLMYNHK
jgi:gliding motility-associated-like protein